MAETEPVRDLLRQWEQECLVEKRALELWLGRLTPLKWTCVGGGVVLPLIAGFTLLGETDALGKYWPLISGALALVAAALTGLHTALKCDPHQAECHRLINAYADIVTSIQSASASDDRSAREQKVEIEARLRETRKSAGAHPTQGCRDRAQKLLAAQHGTKHQLVLW